MRIHGNSRLLALALLAVGITAAVQAHAQYEVTLRVSGMAPTFLETKREAERVDAENRALCLTQYQWQEEETRYKTAYRTETTWGTWSASGLSTRAPKHGFERLTYSSYVNWQGTRVGTIGWRAQSGDIATIGNYQYRASSCHSYDCHISRRGKETRQVAYQEPYQVTVTKSSEQYDWCRSEGYPTQN